MDSADALRRLHTAFHCRCRRILSGLSKFRASLVHTLPAYSHRIWKTFHSSASLVVSPCFAPPQHHMLKMQHHGFIAISRSQCQSYFGVGSGSESNQRFGEYRIAERITIQESCNEEASANESSVADIKERCNEAAATDLIHMPGNEVDGFRECRCLSDNIADRSHSFGSVTSDDNGDGGGVSDEINRKADAFIARFHEHIRLERRDSDLRYFEWLNRCVA